MFGNYYYPQSYPMMDNLAQLRAQQTPPQQNTGLVWVQGEAGAKSYLVAAGNTVPLWDSETQTIYLKTVDKSGMPSMRILDYTERTAVQPVEYVTRKEFEEFISGLNKPKKVKKEDKEEEVNA